VSQTAIWRAFRSGLRVTCTSVQRCLIRCGLLEGLIVIFALLLNLRSSGDTEPQTICSPATTGEMSQFFNPSDLGSDRFLGDCLSGKAIISRPEAGTPTLPPRTISLAQPAIKKTEGRNDLAYYRLDCLRKNRCRFESYPGKNLPMYGWPS